MPKLVWTEEDDARLEFLMQKYDPRERLQLTPGRDMLTATDWDEVIAIETARLERTLRVAMMISSFKEIVPDLWDGSWSGNAVLLDFLSSITDTQQGPARQMAECERLIAIEDRLPRGASKEHEEAVSNYFHEAEMEALGVRSETAEAT